jgi:hypothetical protein
LRAFELDISKDEAQLPCHRLLHGMDAQELIRMAILTSAPTERLIFYRDQYWRMNAL